VKSLKLPYKELIKSVQHALVDTKDSNGEHQTRRGCKKALSWCTNAHWIWQRQLQGQFVCFHT